jgi:hypothetical protein
MMLPSLLAAIAQNIRCFPYTTIPELMKYGGPAMIDKLRTTHFTLQQRKTIAPQYKENIWQSVTQP